MTKYEDIKKGDILCLKLRDVEKYVLVLKKEDGLKIYWMKTKEIVWYNIGLTTHFLSLSRKML